VVRLRRLGRIESSDRLISVISYRRDVRLRGLTFWFVGSELLGVLLSLRVERCLSFLASFFNLRQMTFA